MKKFAPLFIIIAASLWGVDGIVFRPALYTLPVGLVVFIESAVVSILFIPILYKFRDEVKLLSKSEILTFLGVAFFGGALGTMAITKALFYVNYVNLSIVILIQKFQPLFAITLAAIILKEKLSKEFFIWAAFAVVGSYFLTFGFNTPNFSLENKTLIAALFSLLAAFSFGFSTVLSKKAIKNVSHTTATIIRFYFTSLIMIFILIGTGEYSAFNLITEKQIMIFLAIAFSTGGLAIYLYYIGLKYVSASESTILELAFPVTAIFLEYVIHGKLLGIPQWIGAVILIYSIYKITRLYSS
jgi:drug/metabolite transporter (DMT)-like permease